MQIEKSSYSSYDFSKELIEGLEVSRVKFDKCNFRWTDFSEIDVMYSCAFESCDFTNARLNGVTIKDCAFLSCKFNNASFFATTLEECKMTGSDFLNAECGLAHIIGGDWSYTVLRKQSFHKLDLCNIRFFGADLTECHFNQCKMNVANSMKQSHMKPASINRTCAIPRLILFRFWRRAFDRQNWIWNSVS